MIEDTIKAIVQALLQYGVLGIVTIMLAAWTVFQQKRIEALQGAIEQAYRVQVDSLRTTLERAITQTERATAALNELARVEEGRVVENRQYHETHRRRLEELDAKLKATTASNSDVVLASIKALRNDVVSLRGRVR
jgi:hypothetical protein